MLTFIYAFLYSPLAYVVQDPMRKGFYEYSIKKLENRE